MKQASTSRPDGTTGAAWDGILQRHGGIAIGLLAEFWSLEDPPPALWRVVRERLEAVRDAKAFLARAIAERASHATACSECGRPK